MNDLPLKQNFNVKNTILSFSQQDGFSQSPYKKKDQTNKMNHAVTMDMSPIQRSSSTRAPLSNVTNSKPQTIRSTSLSSTHSKTSLKPQSNSMMITDDKPSSKPTTSSSSAKSSIKDFIKQQREKIKNSMESPKKKSDVEIFVGPSTKPFQQGGFADTPRTLFPIPSNAFGNHLILNAQNPNPKIQPFQVHVDDEDEMELEKIDPNNALHVLSNENLTFQSSRSQNLSQQFNQLSQQNAILQQQQQQEDFEKRRRRTEKLNELRMRFQNTTSTHPISTSASADVQQSPTKISYLSNPTSPVAATPVIHQQFVTRRKMKRMRVTFPTTRILSHFDEEDERRSKKFTLLSQPDFGDFASLPAPENKIFDELSSSSSVPSISQFEDQAFFKTPGPRNKLISRNNNLQEKNKKKAKFEYHTPKRNNLMKDANLALKGRHKVKGGEWLSKSKISKKNAALEELRETQVPQTPAPRT